MKKIKHKSGLVFFHKKSISGSMRAYIQIDENAEYDFGFHRKFLSIALDKKSKTSFAKWLRNTANKIEKWKE